jgi:ABC-type transport system substrate-binding protein
MQTIRKAAIGGVLTIAALGGGALGAALLNGSASAQTDPTTTAPAATTAPDTSGTTTPATPDQRPAGSGTHDPSKGGHVANGITETLLTGDTATKVTAAAQAAVPDGTIERVETDAEGAAYEAHMVKADGSHVTVKLDASFTVTSIEDGAK